MSKRKPRYEGPAYCDYQDLFDCITTELEKLYHTLWDKRKEAPKFRTMGKQVKTAWMLWKLGLHFLHISENGILGGMINNFIVIAKIKMSMIVTDSMLQKVYEPGLWFLKSSRPSSDICDLIYELAVKGGAHIFVKAQQNKNIQRNVITRVMKDYLEEATDQNERNWMEQEIIGYHEHGNFDYPEEMNDYIENGYFWNYTVILMDDLHEIGNYNNDIIILEDINDLQYGDEKDLLKILQLNHEDAIEYKDTMIILVQEKSYGPATEFIETHLFV